MRTVNRPIMAIAVYLPPEIQKFSEIGEVQKKFAERKVRQMKPQRVKKENEAGVNRTPIVRQYDILNA